MFNLLLKIWNLINTSPIIYIILTGVIIFYLTDGLNKKKEVRSKKYEIFEAIYSTTEVVADYDKYKKFKLIPVVFKDNVNIIQLFTKYTESAYMDKLSEESDEMFMQRTIQKQQILIVILEELNEQMAIDVGYIKRGEKLLKFNYYPKWLQESEQRRLLEIQAFEALKSNSRKSVTINNENK